MFEDTNTFISATHRRNDPPTEYSVLVVDASPSTMPIDRAPYRVHPEAQRRMDDFVQELEDGYMVERQASAYGSPVTLVVRLPVNLAFPLTTERPWAKF